MRVPRAIARKLDARAQGLKKPASAAHAVAVPSAAAAAAPSPPPPRCAAAKVVPPSVPPPDEEAAVAAATGALEEERLRGDAHEARAYEELLTTLRGLHLGGDLQPRASDAVAPEPPQNVLDATLPMRGRGADDDAGDREIVEAAAEQDLLAAGLMNGVEESAADSEAVAPEFSGSLSAASLRRLLTKELGDKAFAGAHARLKNVVEQDDDDALVDDLQRILGADNLSKLPMMLKLIWLEEEHCNP